MNQTEFMERLKKAAQRKAEQEAEQKRIQQERFRAMMEKIKARKGTV